MTETFRATTTYSCGMCPPPGRGRVTVLDAHGRLTTQTCPQCQGTGVIVLRGPERDAVTGRLTG